MPDLAVAQLGAHVHLQRELAVPRLWLQVHARLPDGSEGAQHHARARVEQEEARARPEATHHRLLGRGGLRAEQAPIDALRFGLAVAQEHDAVARRLAPQPAGPAGLAPVADPAVPATSATVVTAALAATIALAGTVAAMVALASTLAAAVAVRWLSTLVRPRRSRARPAISRALHRARRRLRHFGRRITCAVRCTSRSAAAPLVQRRRCCGNWCSTRHT